MISKSGRTKLWIALLPLLISAWPRAARAVEQVVQLQPGWNAVFLEVEPNPSGCAEQFASLPIEAVWTYENRYSTAQYASSESESSSPLLWRSYSKGRPAFLSDLYSLHAGRGYLVKATASATWTVRGTPSLKDQNWAPRDYTLTGFFVDPASPPTFAAYLGASPVHNGSSAKIYGLALNGSWAEVNKSTMRIDSGKAYWVYTPDYSSYSGPVGFPHTAASGLDYAPGIIELTLPVDNVRGDSRTITVLAIEGTVPMEYFDPAAGTGGQWKSLGSAGVVFSGGQVPAQQIRVRVKRQGIAPGQYQQTLSVTDGSGFRRLLPASVEVEGRDGLWVGHAKLLKSGLGNDAKDAPEAMIPLIIHVSTSGQVQLLHQVTVMWKNGVKDAQGRVTTPGRYVLVTAGGSTAGLSPGDLRDGRPFSYRVTSPVFHADFPLGGTFGSALATTIAMDALHPLNPYMHRYHPDHTEGYGFTREVTLMFTPNDPRGSDFEELPGWGDTVVGGIYQEVIKGLISSDVKVEGQFYLWRASHVGVLNDAGQ